MAYMARHKHFFDFMTLSTPFSSSSNVYRTYNPSKQDLKYAELVCNYRLSMLPPEQSNFRVVSLLTYSLETSETMHHAIACNIEPTPIRGSICAERCAIALLTAKHPSRNFIIHTVYVLTDAQQPKCSGCLCLEFLSSYANPNMKFITFSPTKNKFLSAFIHETYPYPSLYKYVGIPTLEKYQNISENILQSTQLQMKV